MEKKVATDISTGRKWLFTGIIIAAVFVFIEGLLSIYYYQKNGPEKSAALEAVTRMAKSFSSEKVGFVYDPWVEHRSSDHTSENIQIAQSVRRSVPDKFMQGTPGDTLDIYFFGGSTMLGPNVCDSQTIPSFFMKLYAEKFPRSAPVRVFNYGASHYYSYQELILLADLIQKGHRPNVLVFLDGLHDFQLGTASYYHESYFSAVFRRNFNSRLSPDGEVEHLDTTDAMYKKPEHLPAGVFNNALLANYLSTMRKIQMLARIFDARPYFFCQPTAYYRPAGKSRGPCDDSDIQARFNAIYPALEKMQDSLPGFTYLGDMQLEEAADTHIDSLHYSPAVNKGIAQRILSTIAMDTSHLRQARFAYK